MKSRESLIRLRRFEVDEKRQKVTDLETMISDFQQMAQDLDRQIEVEQERAGVSDVNHFAYPTFAKAAVQRRDNLVASVEELQVKAAEEASRFAALKERRDAVHVDVERLKEGVQELGSRLEANVKEQDSLTSREADLKEAIVRRHQNANIMYIVQKV